MSMVFQRIWENERIFMNSCISPWNDNPWDISKSEIFFINIFLRLRADCLNSPRRFLEPNLSPSRLPNMLAVFANYSYLRDDWLAMIIRARALALESTSLRPTIILTWRDDSSMNYIH